MTSAISNFLATILLLPAGALFAALKAMGAGEFAAWVFTNIILALPVFAFTRWLSRVALEKWNVLGWLGVLGVTIAVAYILFEPTMRGGTYYKESEIPSDEFASAMLLALTFPQAILFLITYLGAIAGKVSPRSKS